MANAPEAADPSYWHPELLAGLLRSKRLTVLYGRPGTWRDGMVRRGLMPLLRPPPQPLHTRGRTRRRQVPVRFDGWGPLPLQALRTRIDAEFSAAWPHGSPDTLAAHLRAIGRQHQATVLLVLDGFERHLHERAERHDIERFDIELSECITHEGVPVHVLLVVDELENRALQRYTRWIANFGDDFLRLPSLSPQAADAHSPWHDTDILAPPEGDDDEPMPPHGEGDWPVDVSLDLALPASEERPPAPQLPEPMPVAAPFTESEPMPWPDEVSLPESALTAAPPPPVPVPAVAPVPKAAPPPLPPPPPPTPTAAPISARNAAAYEKPSLEPPTFDFPHLDSHTEAPGVAVRNAGLAGNGAHTAVPPGGRVEPTLFVDPPAVSPPPAPPRTPPPPPAPPAAPSESPFGAWPPAVAGAAPPPRPPAVAGAAPPSGPRAAPPWLSEADVEQMRRMQERGSRWPGLLGLALYMVVLLAGAWWVARWIIDSQRVETRQRPIAETPAAPAPAPAATASPAPAQTAAPPTAAAKPAAPAARGLGVAWPPDSGSAAPLVDELIRLIATPAGVALRAPAANEPPALALMRTDALIAARAANTPLQVVAPLYNEQVQVLVRTDARWDYVREIRGLRLNIGRADGARARTARALYQQLFGTALPAAQANELDLDGALSALQQRASPIDAIVVVSESPIESQLQPAAQRLVRELTIEGRQGAVTSLPGFSVSRRTSTDRARLSTTSYLVAPGTPPRAHDALLRTLAVALCRAQPQLQKQESALLRGFKPNQQPDVGYPYVLPRTPEGSCPLS